MTPNSRFGSSWVLVACLATVTLAGCLGSDPTDPNLGSGADVVPAMPWATIAIIDTGINPYHVDFRAPAELANVHPSEYVPGYPADIETVILTLDAPDLETAFEADADVWATLEPYTPYWFSGTKVTGISTEERVSGGGVFGAGEEVPYIYSTGHGTMTASKAAGNEYSLCPACHVVAVQGSGDGVVWAASQSWIDVQSNSWGPLPAFAWGDVATETAFGDEDLTEQFRASASNQAVFVASGNGAGGALGVVGFPSPTDSTSGPPGVISVGGHDNGKTTLWTGWFPHVVADACDNWSAVGNTIDEYSDSAGGGTSAASPYAAGGAGRLVQEARAILQGVSGRNLDTGTIAVALDGVTLPAKGPLADGDFTLAELKDLLFHTASPTPVSDRASGAECSPASPYHTGPDWTAAPHGVPLYAWVGYGSIETFSTDLALDVLHGMTEARDRPQSDDLYAQDQAVREAYHSVS